jgi:hypothetical protein
MNTLIRCVLTAALAACTATSTLAQVQRNFPATALRGEVVFGTAPELALNGKPARLSPGARIRDTQNMLVMTGALQGRKYIVHYTLEPLGLVHDVWILRTDEAARKPWPATLKQAQEWRFDPVAQSWSLP